MYIEHRHGLSSENVDILIVSNTKTYLQYSLFIYIYIYITYNLYKYI